MLFIIYFVHINVMNYFYIADERITDWWDNLTEEIEGYKIVGELGEGHFNHVYETECGKAIICTKENDLIKETLSKMDDCLYRPKIRQLADGIYISPIYHHFNQHNDNYDQICRDFYQYEQAVLSHSGIRTSHEWKKFALMSCSDLRFAEFILMFMDQWEISGHSKKLIKPDFRNCNVMCSKSDNSGHLVMTDCFYSVGYL